MILYPAIDILDGRAVRLRKGDYGASTVYDEDPLNAARSWVEDGAKALHVVDLDGAREGVPVNLAHVRRIANDLDGTPVQVGGGLRDPDAVADVLAAGATRAILGTAAVESPAFLDAALACHDAGRVVVSVDVRGGNVATAGWTRTTQVTTAEALIVDLQHRGVRTFVYTNVDRDGMLGGIDTTEVTRIAGLLGPGAELICSGGVGSLEDLRSLRALDAPNISGVIVGKALYERRFTVADAIAALA